MIINPKKAYADHYITGSISTEAFQPNGIDFDIQEVFMVAQNNQTPCVLNKDNTKRHLPYQKLEATKDYFPFNSETSGEYFVIPPKTRVDCMSSYQLDLPQGVAAMIIARSTLSRNQASIFSGLWDTGFKGPLGYHIINNANTPLIIEKGTRVGQIIFMSAESATEMYNGSYQNQDTHWTKSIGDQ